MGTSTVSKPARSNAAAISIWPLTPCSRSTASRGRAPVAIDAAATSSLGSNDGAHGKPGSLPSATISWCDSAHSGLSRKACSW